MDLTLTNIDKMTLDNPNIIPEDVNGRYVALNLASPALDWLLDDDDRRGLKIAYGLDRKDYELLKSKSRQRYLVKSVPAMTSDGLYFNWDTTELTYKGGKVYPSRGFDTEHYYPKAKEVPVYRLAIAEVAYRHAKNIYGKWNGRSFDGWAIHHRYELFTSYDNYNSAASLKVIDPVFHRQITKLNGELRAALEEDTELLQAATLKVPGGELGAKIPYRLREENPEYYYKPRGGGYFNKLGKYVTPSLG